MANTATNPDTQTPDGVILPPNNTKTANPEALINDPERSSEERKKSFVKYGLPYAAVGSIIFLAANVLPTTQWNAVVGFVLGFVLTLRNVPYPMNTIRKFFGDVTGEIGPSGLQSYHWPGIGSLASRVVVGTRVTKKSIVVKGIELLVGDDDDAQTKRSKMQGPGSRIAITYDIREHHLRWPLPYLERQEAGGALAPQKSMEAAIDAIIRRFVGLYTREEIFSIKGVESRIADIISGEEDEAVIPARAGNDSYTHSLSDGDPNKLLRVQLKKIGFYIANGGISVRQLEQPENLALIAEEAEESEARNNIIRKKALHLLETKKIIKGEVGRKKGLDVDVDRVTDNHHLETGIAKSQQIRTSKGAQAPGDATIASTILAEVLKNSSSSNSTSSNKK